ncbi:MAG: DUF4290 domain-containing protein [Bacteroidales bacterium]|nr:DUF4290 domain-containing protein [Bacteroidales bacterium]
MEYNTQREHIKISDYGRNVYKLIRQAMLIEDRQRRNRMAAGIVEVMAQVNPKSREHADYKQMLWDHMLMLSDWQLDVDCPYPVVKRDEAELRPHPLHYPTGKIRFPHYGRSMQAMVEKVADMPDGEEKDNLVEMIANGMKRSYLIWNRDSVDDNLIVEQLAEMSNGRLKVSPYFQFRESRDLLFQMGMLGKGAQAAVQQKKKKKKKKKKKATAAIE